jgi:hypothetical protein
MRQRTIRAALIALAAGGIVAVANPAPRVAHDAEVAMANAHLLAQQGAAAVSARLHG